MSTAATHDLVPGDRSRPLTHDDAPALLALLERYGSAVIGRPDVTAEDVRTELTDPDLDPGSPALVDGAGALVGAARVWHQGTSPAADIDVTCWPVGQRQRFLPLLEEAERLAAGRAAGAGHRAVTVDHGLYREDVRTAALLQERGYRLGTSFHRMSRPLDGPVEVVEPPGVLVELVAEGTEGTDELPEEVLRTTHRVHMESFRGHFGFVERPYDDWLAARRARRDWGPLLWARLGSDVVGFCQETTQFVEDEDAGYVLQLGVLPPARGRGVARALLTSAFEGMRRRGRAAAVLTVDTANATGATRLYESVGMRPVVVMDVWRRDVTAG